MKTVFIYWVMVSNTFVWNMDLCQNKNYLVVLKWPDNVHTNITFRHICVTIFAWKSNKYYISWMCICNLSYPAYKSHAPCYSLFFHSVHPVTNVASDMSVSVYILHITKKHSFTMYIAEYLQYIYINFWNTIT
jgi:hypothetical protein